MTLHRVLSDELQLSAHCFVCMRISVLPAARLARRFGVSRHVVDLTEKLRCGCGARDAEIVVRGGRPRWQW